jgi:two-component system response regulator GlrR
VNRAPTRILVVEDQEDVRKMLVTALQIDGHAVDEAASAVEGLECLQRHRYQLVLSDYAMPGGTGSWMFHEATRRGLMAGTIGLIVTAHPDVRDLANLEVINKPLDLERFLEQVRRILAAAGDDGDRTQEQYDDAPAAGSRRERMERVELVLYISSASPSSLQARRNLELLLDGFDPAHVKYTVCDLVREPMAGDADRIAFTPTLVKRYPEPKMWVLGNLKEPEIIADLLRACGVKRKE